MDIDTISMDMVRNLFDQSKDCVKMVDPDGRLIWMNTGGLCAMEIDHFDLVKEKQWCSFWPGETSQLVKAAIEKKPPQPTHFTAYCPTAKGTPKWWEVSIVPIATATERHSGFIATSRDVTDREVATRTREVMLEEMRHRQGNTLTLAAMLMTVHAQGREELASFVREMGDRLAALGRAQAVLGTPTAAGTTSGAEEELDLSGLLQTLVRPLTGHTCSLEIDVEPDLTLPADMLDVVAVIVSELSVNAGKHGAFSSGGRVALTAAMRDDGIELIWSETSQKPVEVHERDGGQGLNLMGRIAAINGASFQIKWRGTGLIAKLLLRA